MKIYSLCGGALVAFCASNVLANTVAITEFINNADGEDSGREFVELYNYGTSTVDLSGQTVSDEDSDSFTFPAGAQIASGDFVIVVSGGSGSDLTPAQAKAVFEAEWLSGSADPRVFGATPFAFGNGGDEIIVSDSTSAVIWSLAYENDESSGVATYLTDDDFTVSAWGTKADPGVVRVGADDQTRFVGDLGYEEYTGSESGLQTSDFAAITDSGFLTGQGIATDFFDNVEEPSLGTPLAGDYTTLGGAPVAVPAETYLSLALFALGLGWVGARRTRK